MTILMAWTAYPERRGRQMSRAAAASAPSREGGTTLTTLLGVIYPQQVDHMGHVNVQYYTAMFDQATWVFLAGFGITARYMRDRGRGMAAVDQRTKYLLELYPGDVVEMRTELLEVKDKSIRFLHTLLRRPDGATAATSEIVGVHFDQAKHRACPFPASVRSRLERGVKSLRG